MPLSAVSVLVVAQASSEIPEGLMNNHVQFCSYMVTRTEHVYKCIKTSAPRPTFLHHLLDRVFGLKLVGITAHLIPPNHLW